MTTVNMNTTKLLSPISISAAFLVPIIISGAFLAFLVFPWTDASRSKLTGYGDEYKVEMYSGGQKVREWTASGKVISEQGSDGYYFNDKATSKLIEVAGDVVITQL